MEVNVLDNGIGLVTHEALYEHSQRLKIVSYIRKALHLRQGSEYDSAAGSYSLCLVLSFSTA